MFSYLSWFITLLSALRVEQMRRYIRDTYAWNVIRHELLIFRHDKCPHWKGYRCMTFFERKSETYTFSLARTRQGGFCRLKSFDLTAMSTIDFGPCLFGF